MKLAARDGKAVGYRMAKPVIEQNDIISEFGGGVKGIFALLECYVA
jgi:hypothetical protein